MRGLGPEGRRFDSYHPDLMRQEAFRRECRRTFFIAGMEVAASRSCSNSEARRACVAPELTQPLSSQRQLASVGVSWCQPSIGPRPAVRFLTSTPRETDRSNESAIAIATVRERRIEKSPELEPFDGRSADSVSQHVIHGMLYKHF